VVWAGKTSKWDRWMFQASQSEMTLNLTSWSHLLLQSRYSSDHRERERLQRWICVHQGCEKIGEFRSHWCTVVLEVRFLWSRPWLLWQTQFYILDLKIVHSGDFGRLSPQIFALVQVGIFWQKHGQQEVCCAVISSDLLHSKFSRGNFSISSIWYGT